jgi:hypothetical protein
MKTIHRCLFFAFLASCATGIYANEETVTAAGVTNADGVRSQIRQYLELRGEAGEMTDADLLAKLGTYAVPGDPAAEVLFADALLAFDGDDTAWERAYTFYSDAEKQGVAGAFLGLARMRLESTSAHDLSEIMNLLMQASFRGSAEADRLLSELVTEDEKDEEGIAYAWALLLRAGQREDVTACIELADAYLNGVWRGNPVLVNEEQADRLLLVASRQKSAEAALRRAIRLARLGVETSEADYEESVQELYNAYLWAHEKGDETLVSEIDRLHDQGVIYIRTWLRAHFLYESTIYPEQGVATSNTEEILKVRMRSGVRQVLRIQGAESGSSLSVLGFAYDVPYLWEGEVSVLENSSLGVASDDPFWPSVIRQREGCQLPCFVRILNGAYAGFVFYVHSDWIAGYDRQIALENTTYASLFGEGTRIALGQWRSLFSVFGEYNSAGLKPGTDAADADQVILFNTTQQYAESFFFNSDRMAWVRTDEPDQEATDVALAPWQALFVLRREKAPLDLLVDGVISETPATLPIDPGFNLVTNLEGRLFDRSGIAMQSGVTIRADQIPVFQADGSGKLDTPAECVHWWGLFGLAANTPLFVNTPAAFIMTSDGQTESFYLQR